MNWQLKQFEELTPNELYDIMWLRNEVFVIEQNCIFQDADYKDQQSWHLMGLNHENKLMAYCRLLPAGAYFEQPSIGRVVTHADARGSGAGKELMQKAIQICKQLFGEEDIKIGAQLYLKKFYNSIGFEQTSDVYMEDGIKHIEMVRIFKKD
jgi:ElaA protein